MTRGRRRRVWFFFASRRRHTRLQGDWSSDVCSSDLEGKSNGSMTPRDTASLSRRVARMSSCTSPQSRWRDSRLCRKDKRSEERRVGKEGGEQGRGRGRTNEETGEGKE